MLVLSNFFPEISQTVFTFLRFVFLFCCSDSVISNILSSRSLKSSSISLILLFIPFSVFFLLVTEPLISYWIFFIFSSFLLKFSRCTSILFPNIVNIHITNALNFLSGKLFVFVSLFIFSGGLSCSFSEEQFFCLFILLHCV